MEYIFQTTTFDDFCAFFFNLQKDDFLSISI